MCCGGGCGSRGRGRFGCCVGACLPDVFDRLVEYGDAEFDGLAAAQLFGGSLALQFVIVAVQIGEVFEQCGALGFGQRLWLGVLGLWRVELRFRRLSLGLLLLVRLGLGMLVGRLGFVDSIPGTRLVRLVCTG